MAAIMCVEGNLEEDEVGEEGVVVALPPMAGNKFMSSLQQDSHIESDFARLLNKATVSVFNNVKNKNGHRWAGVGGNAMWAIMTVVVIFEFQVGSLFKGINRATTTAGTLAFGIHWVASKSGHRVEPIILIASVFLLASATTFSRFMPVIKAKFNYGITVFILTFSLIVVFGYRVKELLKLAQMRLSTIVIGVSIRFFICILISHFPRLGW